MDDFKEIIKSQNIQKIKKLEKVDWHCHCGRSGLLNVVCPQEKLPTKPFRGLKEAEQWFNLHISSFYPETQTGKLALISATFKQFNNDNIKIACINYGYKNIKLFGGLDNFILTMNELQSALAKDTIVLPELGIQRQFSFDEGEIKSYIDSGYFYSIDLNGDELSNPIKKFKRIYKFAENKGLILKAHVGEIGNSDSIITAINELHLTEIYHGISIIESKRNLQIALDNNIFFHVCPTSNYMLSICKSIKNHPIKAMVNAGLNVTICSDDQLLFNSSISNEYFKLYILKTLTLEQLQKIYNDSKNHIKIYTKKFNVGSML